MEKFDLNVEISGKREKENPEEEKKKQVNPEVEKIFKQYAVDKDKIESVLDKLLKLKGLELKDCEVVSYFNEEVKDSQIACWHLKMNDQDKDKGQVKIFEDPKINNLYFQIGLLFPKEFQQVSKKIYFDKEIKPDEVLKKGINVFLKRILESKAPQL